ncbi:metallophosphoesterase [Candidatus Woesearchaeota archaeon]|nr:metallophosphoesterase [Candidatus Woesearchaeota archaeon]
MALESKKKEIVEYCLRNKILITPTLLSQVQSIEELKLKLNINSKTANLVIAESNHDQKSSVFGSGTVDILYNYSLEPKKKTIQDFINYFRSRFNSIQSILLQRQELSNASSISRIKQKTSREKSSFIAMISEKQITKNHHVILSLEDVTGVIKCLVSKDSPIKSFAEDLIDDDIIGVTGFPSQSGLFFVDNIFLPDLPIPQFSKKCPDDVCCAVISDLQIGAEDFMEAQFKNFILWLRGEYGSDDERELSKKVLYLLIVGDSVDGVGIFPGQELRLSIKDIDEQYKILASYLLMIPPHIQIFLSVGNHDASRLSEPQPPLLKRFQEHFSNVKNIVFVSNPSLLNIHKTSSFSGYKFLLYHGCSYFYYAENVPSLKNSAPKIHDRPPFVMKFLLQRRHLAPTYTSWLYMPEDVDGLVINDIPDFFVSGHLHRPASITYKGVTIICSSCWQPQNEYQKKQGHEPLPGIVPVVHFRDNVVSFIDFSGGVK